MRRLSDGRLELKLSYPGNGYFLETHWTQDKNPVTMWIERAYAAGEVEVEKARERARREGGSRRLRLAECASARPTDARPGDDRPLPRRARR